MTLRPGPAALAGYGPGHRINQVLLGNLDQTVHADRRHPEGGRGADVIEQPDHLEVAGAKLDLPNLNNAELPIELVQAILLVKSKPMLSDEETTACVSTFLAYFQTMQPNFWNVLRKTKRPMAYLTATIKAWAEESGLDPKAFTSPTSGTTIARH